MRVIWVTHDVFDVFSPFVKGKPTKGGSWIAPLFYSIKDLKNIKLASITPVVDGMEQKQEIDNVTYYSIGIQKGDNVSNMSKSLVNKYLWAINDFHPDVIHIHGIEKNFALLRKYVDVRIPIVCSIQGIISPCIEYLKYSIANINIKKFKSIKNRVGRGGVSYILRKWKEYSLIEKEIFKLNKYFIGRTDWDKAQLSAMNADAFYFHGEELLRSPFYDHEWEINKCERNRIFVSSAQYPIKGFHVLLHAVAILKEKYPDVKVIAPLSAIKKKYSRFKDFLFAEDYSNYLKNEIKKLNLEENIIMLKRLTAEEMAMEYKKAHVFVLPSFIENSPNSLGEAMMVGTPSVVAPVGGVTSIVKDYESSLYFRAGDYAVLAYQINRLFTDDVLAQNISKKAKNIALKRHNVSQTTEQYCTIYSEIINRYEKSR